jgi:tetratricopeptide (TPR) repeat protein
MKRRLLVMASLTLLLGGCGGIDQTEMCDSFKEGVFLEMGETFLDIGQYDLAETQFKTALSLVKDHNDKSAAAEVWTRLGQTYSAMGKAKEALDALKKAHTLYQQENADGILFNVDKRVWKECLACYAPLLRKAGNEKEAAEVEIKLASLQKKLGSLERIREITVKAGKFSK